MAKANVWDEIVDISLKSAQQEFGAERCYVGAEHMMHQQGMRLPTLALRWLLESNVWPLSRFTQSGGPKASFKSAFCFQLETWALEAGGLVTHIDTENKVSMTMLKSMLPKKYFNPEDPAYTRLHILNATSIEEWQKMASNMIKIVQEFSKKAQQPKPPFPIVIAIDSLLGSKSNEALAHVAAEGVGQGRGYSDAPIILSNYLGSYPDQVMGWPILLHAVHHEKPSMMGHGMSRAGGKAPGFYATLDLQFSRSATATSKINSWLSTQADINRAKLQGKNVRIKIRKSSMCSDVGKDMVVPICWVYEHDKATDVWTQRTWWDWYSTTAMILKANARKLNKAGIMDVQSERKGQGRGEHFWSDHLDIKKDAAVPAPEFGKYIETGCPELLKRIERMFMVVEYPIIGEPQEQNETSS